MPDQNIDNSRFYSIGFAAMTLLVVTVSLGLFLGTETRRQFGEIQGSWSSYNGEVGQKGAWISSIRGHLGYGGIIHNFKNYILRRDLAYFQKADQQVQQFNEVVEAYLGETKNRQERDALRVLHETITLYSQNLAVAHRAVIQGMNISDVDALVRIDDSLAEKALRDLEEIWTRSRKVSTYRIFSAVAQGQKLIGVGFVSIVALILASLTIGTLLIYMLRDMRSTMQQLTGELAARHKAEAAQARLASVVEQSPATIVMTDTNARILYANRRFRELTGWSGDEIEGQTPRFLQSGDTAGETYGDIRTQLAAGQEWQGVFRNRKRDGTTYWADTRILPLLGPDGTVQNFIGIGEDITERRQAREQVARAQKLEAVGLLAGGIAHDFNNVLTTIVGAAHLAALDAPKGSDIAAEIEQIEIATKRAQSLVHGLLTFARREPAKPRPVDLCGVVKEVARLLRASLPPTLALDCGQAEGRVMALADHTKLHQIVMNLTRNAAEAIGAAEGCISVRVLVLEDTPRDLAQRADGWVVLKISDNGPGMSAETRARLFDPFFTTKPIGKGSGLGLVVVSGLVEELGGRIEVDSAPGEGAQFTIYLPATSLPETALSTPDHEAPRGHERIMLVDDETEISATWRRVLMRLGYRVEAYTSSVIAAEKLVGTPDRFDLLITDMVMPDLSGEDLANKARALRPDIPIIICTGYTPSSISIDGAAPDVLAKPVDPIRLARQVRAALDG